MKDIEDSAPLEWLHITGGEPFLFQGNLREIIEAGKEYGVSNIGTATNTFWAVSREVAVDTLSVMKKAGMTGLCVSADYFHQAHIPLERVRNALHATKYLNLNGHSYVTRCFIGSRETECLENRETGVIIDEIEDCGIPVAEVPLRQLGRGARYESSNECQLEGPCEELCICLGETGPRAPQMVYVDACGLVQICYGLTIGTLEKRSLRGILTGYDSSQDVVIDTIARIGPAGLLPLAERSGYQRKQSYVNKCHLCYDVRTFLVPYHPSTLSPLECYPRPWRKTDVKSQD